jgi:large subunit ribosomal protein L9
LHELRISLHGEVEPRVVINVARSADEATRQARGEDVTRAKTEAEEDTEAAQIAAEALFEEHPPAALDDESKGEVEAGEGTRG